jgi:hypothetical protein
MTTVFTPYTAWPVLETVAHQHGFSLAPEFFEYLNERADAQGDAPARVLARQARDCGLDPAVAVAQYHDFLDGMRRLFRRK